MIRALSIIVIALTQAVTYKPRREQPRSVADKGRRVLEAGGAGCGAQKPDPGGDDDCAGHGLTKIRFSRNLFPRTADHLGCGIVSCTLSFVPCPLSVVPFYQIGRSAGVFGLRLLHNKQTTASCKDSDGDVLFTRPAKCRAFAGHDRTAPITNPEMPLRNKSTASCKDSDDDARLP